MSEVFNSLEDPADAQNWHSRIVHKYVIWNIKLIYLMEVDIKGKKVKVSVFITELC